MARGPLGGEISLGTTAKGHEYDGGAHRDRASTSRRHAREQIWKRLTSVIGLARIEWCQRQGRHESQEDHRAATRRTAPRELCGRFLGPLCQQHQREKARHKRWAIYVI